LRDQPSRISVIIPTLQEENYIANILSKLQELNPQVEVIVVDGGSKDKTVEIAQRFTNKVYKTSKRGIAAGRNYGAAKANGDILVFLDTDVTFPTDFPEKVLQTFSKPTVAGATCNIMPLRNQFGTTAFFKLYNLVIQITAKFKPHSRGEFFAVRKTAFRKAKGFDESMPCLEDHNLAWRLSRIGEFVFISDLTVCESLRRFRKLGFYKVIGTWTIDYIFFMLRGKPLSPEWKPVR
jgi:cellulose synthase/poly-beta-1,6-N-acetylglucosamine synthase-like glycosyltransferase